MVDVTLKNNKMELAKLNTQPLFINEFFSSFFENEFNNKIQPKENIIEKDDEYIIELLVPGIQKDDLSINIEENKLIIRHSLKSKEKEDYVNYIKLGFNKESFNREFNLSKKIDISNISASFDNGILSVKLPKKKIIKTIKKIKIK